MPADARIRTLRIRAQGREGVVRASGAVEHALRTAAVPGLGARLLLVRRLDLGRLPGNFQRTADRLERLLRAAARHAVHASHPSADRAEAVWFDDDVEAFVRLALRVARGEPVEAWFWRRIADAAENGRSTRPLLPRLLLAAAATRSGFAAAARVLAGLRAANALDALADAPLLEAHAAELLRAVPDSAPHDSTPFAHPPPLGRDWAQWIRQWSATWGRDDTRTLLLALAALASSAPSFPISRKTATTLLRSLAHDPAASPREMHAVTGAPPPTPQAADRVPAVAGLGHEPGTATRRRLDREPDNEPADTALTDATHAGRATSAGGLFFLVNALESLGLPRRLLCGGTPAALPWSILAHVAHRLRIDPRDPVATVAHSLAPRDRVPPPQCHAWYRALARWTRCRAGITLQSLVRRPAHVTVTDTHIDITLELESADVQVRRAGLDLDPGWTPWLGRVIAFHYGDPQA